MRMQSGPLGEMSYLQPDHFENEKKNMSEFMSQNPLVMLARTCQNIGLEHHKSSERPKLSSPFSDVNGPYNSHSNSLGELNLFSMSQQMTPPTVSAASRSCINLNTAHRLSPPTGFSSPIGSTSRTTTTATFVPPISPTITTNKDHDRKSLSGDEADLQAHPSSDSLIQLARLSSNLKLSGDRQKRNKPADSRLQTTYSRQQKRVRRQSFSRPASGIPTSKPIDFTVHPTAAAAAAAAMASQRRSNTSTPSTSSSSVSPSSLRSSPPAHSTSPFSLRNGQPGGAMLDITSVGQAPPPPSATSCLEMFYSVGNALGASPERLRELLVTVAQALMDRSQSSSSTEASRPPVTSSASSTPASNGGSAGGATSPSGLLFEGGRNEGTQSVPQPQLQQQQQATQQLRSPQPPLNGFVGSTTTNNNNNDPSTQCLCCGLMCADMNSLVQHIYSHLPTLHSQSSKPQSVSLQPQPLASMPVAPPMPTPLVSSAPAPSYCSSTPSSSASLLPPSAVNPIFEVAANYARYLQKLPSSLVKSPAVSAPLPPELMVPPPTAAAVPPATDPNALFLAWLNMFRPSCAPEALAAAAAAAAANVHRFG